MKKRIFEIDAVRALAIILMVIFHFVYDINEFLGIDVDYMSGFWYYEGKFSALLFMFISGISSGFSRKLVKRGIKILSFGILITVVTRLLFPSDYIRFGILHFLGIAIILSPFLLKLKTWILLTITLISFVIGNYTKEVLVNTFLLLPLGFMYKGFSSMDYYPVFPYIGYFILGIIVYKEVYFKNNGLAYNSEEHKIISLLSQNSLKIYILHQPMLLFFIILFRKLWTMIS